MASYRDNNFQVLKRKWLLDGVEELKKTAAMPFDTNLITTNCRKVKRRQRPNPRKATDSNKKEIKQDCHRIDVENCVVKKQSLSGN